MNLILLKETTQDWTCRVPNHTYIFGNSSSMYIIGYVKQGETKAIRFKRAMFFDKSRRKFVALDKSAIASLDMSEFADAQ